MEFVGREDELRKIKTILSDPSPSIIIVYGRRRIGKTHLIEHSLENHRYLKIEGKQGYGKLDQIKHSLYTLSKFFNEPYLVKLQLKTWTEVFDLIAQKMNSGTWVLYLEELQWLAHYESELISDLKEVWDNNFRKNPNFKLILCGSAPSFMISKVVRSKALYNRSQHIVPLNEFSLKEVSDFFNNKKSHLEVMDAVLSVGGIPEYLSYLRKDSSVYLSLCKNSFDKGSFFSEEYEKIFTSSLSENPYYKKIIEFLALKKSASRAEILSHLKIKSGGSLSAILLDLELCQFIEAILPYTAQNKGRIVRYCIADNYLHFYFKFIHPHLLTIRKNGIKNIQTIMPIYSYKQWLGYAFERWCRKNHFIIAQCLGFSDVEYKSGAYFKKDTKDKNFQIDLLFERKDRVLTVCEIKYSDLEMDSSIINEFKQKLKKLGPIKNKTIQRILICAVKPSEKISNEFDKVLSINELFNFYY